MSGRVVLFGECGFVGSSLLKRLEMPEIVAPTLEEADLTNVESLRGALKSGDIVINAAGYANATDTTERGRALFQAVNVDGVRNLASACDEVGVAQLVHISSVAAMGRWHRENVTEDMLKPVGSPYAESKLEGERILAAYQEKLPVTVLRPTSVFGENRGLAATLCKLVSKGTVPLPGGGSAGIPFTYIGNVAHAVKLALGNSSCHGRTFIVGDAQSYPLRDIVLALAKSMGIQARIVSIPTPIAYAGTRGLEIIARMRGSTPVLDRGRLDTLTGSVSYSIAAFQEATYYEPPYSMEEAARRIAAWYRSEQDKRG